MISVLIADDQRLIRKGLRMLLEAEPDLRVTGEASDGSQALAEARRLEPDVILMDVRMPGLDGIQATAQLGQGGSRAKILMLTTFNLDEYVYHAMKAGASGFLLKDATREQLTGAIRAVCAGDTLLAPAITRRLIEDFCRGPAPGTPAGSAGRLSEREREVVRLIAAGLSNAEIASSLYLSEATIKSHITRILARLGLRDRVQIAVYAYEHAIVRPGQGTPPGGQTTRP
jgi:DNA-binding NarL/FixJ family response regulator